MRPLKLAMSHSAAFSPDGRLLATDDNRYVYLWDIESRKKIARFRPFPWAGKPAFSPDGDRLALKSTSGHICVVEVPSGTVLSDFENDADGEGCRVFWSTDGEHLIDGSWRGVFRAREWSTGRVAYEQTFSGETVSDISCSADRAQWVIRHQPKRQPGMSQTEPIPPGSLSIRTWPFSSGSERVILPRASITFRGVALSPDGCRIAVIRRDGQDRNLLVLSADGHELVSRRLGIGFDGGNVSWSNDGRLIAAGLTWREADVEASLGWRVAKSVVVWDSGSMEVVWQSPTEMKGTSATFSPDDSMVAISGFPGWLLPVDF